jgi:predicted ATP-grasp superfamily ATP-dependent carboligase
VPLPASAFDVRARGSARVLVTSGEQSAALAALRALRAAGHEPWVVAPPGSYSARSRATAGVVQAPDPARAPAEFVRTLASLSERHGFEVILPGAETPLLALSLHPEGLPDDVVVANAPLKTVERATDKSALAELAQRAGLETPPTVTVSVADLDEGSFAGAYPAIVKPLRSELAVEQGAVQHFNSRRVSSADELRAALSVLPGGRGLVQPQVAGSLTFVAGVSWEDKLVASAHHLGERTWPPYCGPVASGVTVPRDRDLDERVRTLLALVGWNGIFQMQFISSPGRHMLIDLNPRVYGSLALTVAAGLNLPAIWVGLLLGREPVVPPYRTGVRYRAEELDARALIASLRNGDRRAALTGLLPRRRTTHAVCSARDPLPLLTSAGKIVHAGNRYLAARREGSSGFARA